MILLVGLHIQGIAQTNSPAILYSTSNSSANIEKLKITISKSLNDLNECQDKDCRARVYHFIASIHFALSNNDSIWYYLEKSYTESPKLLCKYVNLFDELNRGSMVHTYFATSFSEKWLIMHQARCESMKSDIEIVAEPDINDSKNIIYQTAILEMDKRDQMYRGIDWVKQDSLDLINRTILDKLFESYGFSTKQNVSLKCRQTIWLVIHHSKDCEWTKKWIIRYLNAYQNGEIEANFLDHTIKRFFDSEKGYCKENREDFIKLLKLTYPYEYGKLFGYNNY